MGFCVPSQDKSFHLLRFGAYQVDLRAGELLKDGRKIKLQVQPFRVLSLLLEHAREVVTREELQKKLWPSDTFVDFDHSLNTAIRKLRQALCDDKDKPRFIETLPKRGYRFMVTPERGASERPAASQGASSLAGKVARLAAEGEHSFALVCVDEQTAEERDKLDAASDDVGLSLLIATQRLLMVLKGTPVRILAVEEMRSHCQVRILDGEHYGKTAWVPLAWLAELPAREGKAKRGL